MKGKGGNPDRENLRKKRGRRAKEEGTKEGKLGEREEGVWARPPASAAMQTPLPRTHSGPFPVLWEHTRAR